MDKTIDDMQQEVSAKAATDMAFRAQLLANPKAAIEGMYDLEMPAGMKVHAFELNPDDVMIALPRVDKADGELSDDDLEAVAGGAAKPGGMGGVNVPKPVIGAPTTGGGSKLGSLFIAGAASELTGLSTGTVKLGIGAAQELSGKKICA